jgi:hypothetical protein
MEGADATLADLPRIMRCQRQMNIDL